MDFGILSTEAAWRLCAHNRWNVSDYRMHHLLYLSNMLWMGQTLRPLFAERFVARGCGPQLPSLVNAMGAQRGEDVRQRHFIDQGWGPGEVGVAEEAHLRRVCKEFAGISAYEMEKAVLCHELCWDEFWYARFGSTGQGPIDNRDVFQCYTMFRVGGPNPASAHERLVLLDHLEKIVD